MKIDEKKKLLTDFLEWLAYEGFNVDEGYDPMLTYSNLVDEFLNEIEKKKQKL